jgi:uncharacterized protein YwqG
MVSKIPSELTLPILHPALERYRADLEKVAKPAWLLRCRKVNAADGFETHFGGVTPFAPVSDGWPCCDRCGCKLHFVWQVNFAHFEGTFSERGLFQFFYCWRCNTVPPDTSGFACRWYPDFDPQQVREKPQLSSPYEVNMAPYHLPIGPCIVDVVPFLSVPGKFSKENPIPQDAQNEIVSKQDGRLWSVYSSTKGFYLEDEMVSRLGGFPPWVQFRDETPQCPVCGMRAEFVGAIGSEDTNLIWGDSGYWYFFACKVTAKCHGLAKPLMAFQCY